MKVSKKIIKILKNDGVGVLPTDTLHGLVGSAFSKKAVKRIYKLKKRSPDKPLIILIADLKDLTSFGIQCLDIRYLNIGEYWPGKVSIALQCPKCPKQNTKHLVCRNSTMGFRLPKPEWLRDLLRQTGPLVAPSANPEGKSPAQTIGQAKKYFDNKVDFYFSKGKLAGQPSTLIKIDKKGKVEVLRQGAVKI